MKRILILGSRPLSKKVGEFLLACNDIDIVGKVVLPKEKHTYWTEDLSDLDIPTVDPMEIDFDLGISVNYWNLIKPPLLFKPELGFINIHHTYNLRLRGRNTTTFAILRSRTDNIYHHGSTIHYLNEELDAGKIIATCSCPIYEVDTAKSLFERTEARSFEMIKEWLPRIWRESIIPYEAPSSFQSYKNKDLPNKEIDLNLPGIDIYDIVRALTFPPLERPYIMQDNIKRYLTINSFEGSEPIIEVSKNKTVYLMDT